MFKIVERKLKSRVQLFACDINLSYMYLAKQTGWPFLSLYTLAATLNLFCLVHI